MGASVTGPIGYGTKTLLSIQQDENGNNLPTAEYFYFQGVYYENMPTDFAIQLFIFCQTYNL